ncbi:MAG: copper oxidase [Myxococcales bacterium]|nr:MAG: copper oxidase [Myxococcales bacterium]
MNRRITLPTALFFLALAIPSGRAQAAIDGIEGTTFNLVADAGYISGGDGLSLYFWGYGDADGTGSAQYTGPTLKVQQGELVTVNLTNNLPEPVSIVFPGQENVESLSGVPGLIAYEAAPSGGTAQYRFLASQPGTYLYHSGTHADLQVPLGLVGALIVYPPAAGQAYAQASTAFDHEYLFLLTEMDLRYNQAVEWGLPVDTSDFKPVYWFINGRNAPDTMLEPGVPWLPTQPYSCMPMMRPGEVILMRLIGGGRDSHPFHHHGNHTTSIAMDGRVLGGDAEMGHTDFTHTVSPGQTIDTLFTWTGEALGWDIYGHAPGDPPVAGEYMPDHGKPIPVLPPEQLDQTVGDFYSGSPFLGVSEDLPPGTGPMGMDGGYFFMWHSHAEKEMVNNDIFPGGMMTMVVIIHPDAMMHP